MCAQEAQHQILDLGQQLLGFLRRYGRTFDLMADGIAPGRGGIVCKVSFTPRIYTSLLSAELTDHPSCTVFCKH